MIAMAKAGSFADFPAIVNMPGRSVNSGTVFVKNGNKVSHGLFALYTDSMQNLNTPLI